MNAHIALSLLVNGIAAVIIDGDMHIPDNLALVGTIQEIRKWNTGPLGITTIEYLITASLESINENITQALSEIENVAACLKFKKINGNQRNLHVKEYILFEFKTGGCFSAVGRQEGGPTRINLDLDDPGCTSITTIQHEVMHALGFIHEHQRPDRDAFIKINKTVIQDDELLRQNNKRKSAPIY